MSMHTDQHEQISHSQIAVGDAIRFQPDSRERAWWTVTNRDHDHVVAVRQAPFEPKGTVEYTVTGVMEGHRNGAGPGLIRSSLNTLGGGWDLSNREGVGSEEILDVLRSGKYELSMRRVIDIHSIHRKSAAQRPTPDLDPSELAEVARFGIHDETPGLPEVTIERGDR